MAYPDSGWLKIYPYDCEIVQGLSLFSLNNAATPQASVSAADLDTYYDLRVANNSTAPCMARATEIPVASGNYVPGVGTYELKFHGSNTGIEFYNSYPGAVVATLDLIDSDFPFMLLLDNSSLYIAGQVFIGPSRNRSIDNSLNFKVNGSSIGIHTTFTDPATNTYSLSKYILPYGLYIGSSMIEMLGKNFGFVMSCSAVTSVLLNTPTAIFSECFFLCPYTRIVFTSTTPSVLPGGIAEVTSPTSFLETFDINLFKIYWDTLEGEEDANPLFPGWAGGIIIPRNLIFAFTSTFLRFQIPTGLGIPYGGRRLMLTGTSVNGSGYNGEFSIQNFNIELVDGSGLYVLTDDKRNDTYYDRSVAPIETVDLKIPDPSVKTGYFGS